MTFALFAFALAWKFVAPDATSVVAMEWKRVLDSPLSASVRREIPPTALPVLGGINFIEGIERVVWMPGLVVLEGSFDSVRLRDSAVADGGVLTSHRQMELVTPADKDGTAIGLSPSLVLLGSADTIKAAIDRSEKNKSEDLSAGYDLWVRTAGEGFARHDFGLRVSENVRLTSVLRYLSEDSARVATVNAPEFQLTASQARAQTSFHATLSNEAFQARQWRTAIETLHTRVPKPAKTPGVIRVYGLDEGVKEIPLK